MALGNLAWPNLDMVQLTLAKMFWHFYCWFVGLICLLLFPSDDGRTHQLRDLAAGGQQADVHGQRGWLGQVLGYGVR